MLLFVNVFSTLISEDTIAKWNCSLT